MIYTMHRLVEIASYPGNPPTYAPITVFDGKFSSVSTVFGCAALTRPASFRPLFGLHSHWAPASVPIPELRLPAG